MVTLLYLWLPFIQQNITVQYHTIFLWNHVIFTLKILRHREKKNDLLTCKMWKTLFRKFAYMHFFFLLHVQNIYIKKLNYVCKGKFKLCISVISQIMQYHKMSKMCKRTLEDAGKMQNISSITNIVIWAFLNYSENFFLVFC